MKKFTFLFIFAICAILVNAQTNLVTNPSFEDWTDGKPTGWTIPANPAHASAITVFEETSIHSNGLKALKVTIDDTQNPGIQQVIPITAGRKYTVSLDYYVVAGDGTDVRIWSSFKNSGGFYNTAAWTNAIAADANIQKQLQGSGTNTNGYFTIDNETWGTYSTSFTAPADATDFVFEVRTYKSSTVIYDNFSFVENAGSGVANSQSSGFAPVISGDVLLVSNVADGSKADLFNTIGQKIKSATIENGQTSLAGLTKGIYIVKVGSSAAKIIVK